MDNSDKTNEELTGVSENHADVFEGDSNFTWGDDVAEASGVEENIYGLRGVLQAYIGGEKT